MTVITFCQCVTRGSQVNGSSTLVFFFLDAMIALTLYSLPMHKYVTSSEEKNWNFKFELIYLVPEQDTVQEQQSRLLLVCRQQNHFFSRPDGYFL